MLQEVSDEMGLNAKRQEGEAALYGPKLDFMFKDATGREVQIPTVQVDFASPKRFELAYINESGEKVPPVMVHRAILGSYERFLALVIEHFAGAFPLWLAPVQVVVLPVSQKHAEYAQTIFKKLSASAIRSEIDAQDETLGKRIRNAQNQKIPFTLVVGDKEVTSSNVSVRSREKGDLGTMEIDEFISESLEKINTRSIE
jgi:threonyl-tRNA synthetase